MSGPKISMRSSAGVASGRWPRSVALSLALSILSVLLTGCFDTKQEITLNPDGSGKVTFESTITEVEPLVFGDFAAASEESVNQAARKLLEKAEGVDAWRDLSFRELEDGRLFVRATAYFSDLSKLKTDFNSILRFRVTKDAKSQLVIEPRPDTSRSPVRLPETNDVVTAETIRRTRKQFRALKPLFDASFGTTKLDTVIHVSGEVRSASNFDSKLPCSLRLRFDGARLLAVIEELLFDPETNRRLLAGGTEFDANFANEKLYGQRAPVVAVVKPGKPLFDYAAEVAEARKAFPALARSLGIEGNSPQPKPAVDGLAARVAVTEVKFRPNDSEKAGLRFRMHSSPYTVCLKGDFAGAVSSVDEIELTRAITIEGINLVPRDSAGHRFLSIPQGGTNVEFEVHLQAPPMNSKGLAELAGYLQCGSADNRRSVELVSGGLAQGAVGKAFGTEIEFVGSNAEGGERLVLRTDLEEEMMRSVKVIGDAGQAVVLSQRGLTRFGARRSYTFVASGVIPRSGRLVADIRVGSQKVRIPFAVTNITLLGQPLASR